MSLYQQWSDFVEKQGDAAYIQEYYLKEKNVYQEILANKITKIEDTVEGLSKKWNLSLPETAAFLSGINTSLKEELDIDSLEAADSVKLDIEYEKLLWNMYNAKAEWLYNLEEWNDIFDKEKRDEIRKNYLETVTAKREKPGRNDPCPCGSGKKYKKCCGA
ncbi:MAG: SEC-C metal-binding domain-containing protein [Clostridia bacterium]|jgi:preprotein translocase subunit SecA